MSVVQRTYLRPGFPVFSFAYAWYADAEFSLEERKQVAVDPTYRGFLDHYLNDPVRTFAPEARDLVSVVIQGNPVEPKGGHRPTRAQSWALMPFIVAELANLPGVAPSTPPAPSPFDRTPASRNAERPLLSCLACIFLNQDRRFKENVEEYLCDYGLGDESVATLRGFAASPGDFLTHGQALSLSAALVDEFIRHPVSW